MTVPPLAADQAEVDALHTSIAGDILASIERGEHGAWICPWHGQAAVPTNAFSGRKFKGSNLVALWAAARRKKFKVHLWASPRAWESRGAKVRHGESGTEILVPIRDETAVPGRWSPDQPGIAKKVGPLGGDAEGGETGPIRGFKSECWYSHGQVDGAPPAADLQRLPSPDEGAHQVEALLARWRACGGPALVEGGLSAHWDRSVDRITMPPAKTFANREGLSGHALRVGTLCHEHIHATGSKHRLCRPMKHSKNSPGYAKEELAAELGSALLCAEFGLPTAMRADHAAYIASWMSMIADAKKRSAFFWAVGEATKAVAFLKRAAGE